MIYFFYGNDGDSIRIKVKQLSESLLKKRPNSILFKIDDENWSDSEFENYVGGMGLFEKKYIVILDRLFNNKDAGVFLDKKLNEIKESPNIFIIREEKVLADRLKKISKYSEKVQEISFKKEKGKRDFMSIDGKSFSINDFNIFSLGDALGKRDKKNLWTIFWQAMELDIPPEEISGVMFWQIKSMILSSKAKTATEAGISPFVFSKSKKYLVNWPEEKLKNVSSELTKAYHQSRMGGDGLSLALEKMILKM